jgi:NAD(P)-dependent dehydrogenase (short-subunit alcohol dehydrogenase family)
MATTAHPPVALITGASRGLGAAIARRLAADGWSLVIDARGPEALEQTTKALANTGLQPIYAIPGDVADAAHRAELVDACRSLGGLDALVNNASVLGPSPQPALAEYPIDVLRHVYEVNVIAPLALASVALPLLRSSHREGGGRIVNITSDAGVEAYESWGGYGSSKAALEHASRVLAVEEPNVRVYVVDPGDMNTQMHQEAFPGEDISDRPPPEGSVPGVVALLNGNFASGRYQAHELATS